MRFSSQQRTVLWVLWLTYGSLYFCRNNLGVAIPGLRAELGYSTNEMGTVLAVLKIAYGIGQFVNGQLAEHVRPRKLLAIGLLASAALNVIFGWATAMQGAKESVGLRQQLIDARSRQAVCVLQDLLEPADCRRIVASSCVRLRR
jgi:sugar phosphate permease